MVSASEKLSEGYNRSRDYSRLLGFPEFTRFVEEVRHNQTATIERLTHLPDEKEHDKLVEIRYFNMIMDSLEGTARQRDSFKEKLEELGISTHDE